MILFHRRPTLTIVSILCEWHRFRFLCSLITVDHYSFNLNGESHSPCTQNENWIPRSAVHEWWRQLVADHPTGRSRAKKSSYRMRGQFKSLQCPCIVYDHRYWLLRMPSAQLINIHTVSIRFLQLKIVTNELILGGKCGPKSADYHT